MKKFHPALVALTIIGSILIATATRAETQDTGYQGNAPYARPYRSQYAHPYHSQYAHPYHSQYARPYHSQYARPYHYRYARPYYYRGTRYSLITATRTPTAIGTWVTSTRTPTAISTRDSIITATRTGDVPHFVEVGEAGIAVDHAMRRQLLLQRYS
jgi:hypothetical protein